MSTSASTPKTVLITGCSSRSIGEHLALEFHRLNWHVIATARSTSRLTTLQNLGIRTLELDITSSSSIDALRSEITHLDMLFNNSGINYVGAITDTSMEETRRQFDVNFFGTLELTKAFIPLLIASGGTIVNHTSHLAHVQAIFCGAYGASKAALASLTDTLRYELSPFDVRVIELVTGIARSNVTEGSIFHSDVPDTSLYFPVRDELLPVIRGKGLVENLPGGDVYAKQVVGELLGKTSRQRMWKGHLATPLHIMFILGCLWKGLLDAVFLSTLKMHVLKKKLRAKSREGKKST